MNKIAMEKFQQHFSFIQIKALLKKELLLRARQPWITLIKFLWPCMIFLTLYTLRNRFTPAEIQQCQFPTRLLPSESNLLPFFHSYICTLDNACVKSKEYEEYSNFNEAPLTPIINIVQTFLNEDALYSALIDLPTKMNFAGAVLSVTSHPKFEYIKNNINEIMEKSSTIDDMKNFDIKKIFSDDDMFSDSGKIICGKPFPYSENIRIVDNIISTEDLSGPNQDELEAMPTVYCKKLYLDVTSSNNGKFTWSQLKPLIQGKIIYGPQTEDTKEIINYANATFYAMSKFQKLSSTLNDIVNQLHSNSVFLKKFYELLDLIKSSLVQMVAGDSINITVIESVMNLIATDETIKDVFETVHNILECFSVDRFLPIETKKDLLKEASQLAQKNLFYAGIYFQETMQKNVIYDMFMDIDNTPITIENENRFWFPGPEGSFQQNLRYHRGFIQIQHSVDIGIVKLKKKQKIDEKLLENSLSDWSTEDDDLIENFNNSTQRLNKSNTELAQNESMSKINSFLQSIPILSDQDQVQNESELMHTVEKRSPQFDGIFSALLGAKNVKQKDKSELDEISFYTKQFPYPKYVDDDFKKGLYLAQSIQMAFFIGLLVQVATCIRYKIWMRESKNCMLMRSMGMKCTSETISWAFITLMEIIIIFILACGILYIGGIMQHTSILFLLTFLLLFGVCLISFCYMCSTFFSSASIGSVTSSILFLITFLPYIIIVSLGKEISVFMKFITNLSFSTAFCYAWKYIMRTELQTKTLSFSNAFDNNDENEFQFAILMIILDLLLYSVIGYIVQQMNNDEYKFHTICRDNINPGALIENASKIYDDLKVGLSNVSMTFPKNNISCILGRNGAGKSTIIKLLTGQIKPNSGIVILSNIMSDEVSTAEIGFSSQDNILLPNLTAREHLEIYARIKLKNRFEIEIEKIMKILNFGKYENVQVWKLSGGYQRRLCVAIAFIGAPNLVILDEPCSGIDISARKCVWELIQSLRKGRAIVVATHYLDEAEYLGDLVFMLNDGKLMAEYNSNVLKDLMMRSFDLVINTNENQLLPENIELNLKKNNCNYMADREKDSKIKITIPYDELKGEKISWFLDFLKYLEELQLVHKIKNISINTNNLEQLFNISNEENNYNGINGKSNENFVNIKLNTVENVVSEHVNYFNLIKQLFWKRMLHFHRNYKLLICMLVLYFK